MNTSSLHCPVAESDDVVAAYVAGTLAPAEAEKFELHLLECLACRNAVRAAAALRAALRASGSRAGRARLLWWALPTAAAAIIAVILLARPAKPLQRLGGLDSAPEFAGLPVRTAQDSASALADRGMAAYAAADYARAAALLARVPAQEGGTGVAFFLGAAQLLRGRSESAVVAFRRALEPPDNPYAAEARLYLAKAWLRLGQADSALAQLGAVPASAAAVHAHASALSDSVRNVMR